ncbi:oxidoreductase [Asanoa ishikariensis]|uniref:NDP-hexose 2,3-enoyl reductase n=1 Tax=Asanoa ishikariensis TaxID=137265 RepID=A0A1H3LID5_9ACTN|nr:aldo/keto reductase [Asanoa ishikariensis]GIF65501.1 oxidoreductase [Asanoa ishikariensis]SDY64086.1 NDP-hexose 2,3-enoyl reductase [Asanoa ishikariensis]
MEFTNLGRTGLTVSRLCLGTMNFGPETSEADSFAIMDRALEHGLNFFDTANVYGRKVGEGVTEQIIGRWMAQGDGRRDKVVLATKVYGRMGDWPNERGLSARHIVRACEDSLRRLQTDTIDLYQMHHISRTTPWEEIWQAMELLVAQGKVSYVGSSNFAGWHLARAQESAARRNFLGLVSEQCLYNLVARGPELELIPAAQDFGIGIIPWSPLHGGLLSGVLRKLAAGEAGRGRTGRAADDLATYRESIEAYEKLCADLGQDPSNVALAWLLSRPGVTAPIIGPRTMAQLDGAVAAVDIELSKATLGRLDELFPPVGKGGPAPEAWAW